MLYRCQKFFIDRKDRKFWIRMSKFIILLIYHSIFILSNFFKKRQIFVVLQETTSTIIKQFKTLFLLKGEIYLQDKKVILLFILKKSYEIIVLDA